MASSSNERQHSRSRSRSRSPPSRQRSLSPPLTGSPLSPTSTDSLLPIFTNEKKNSSNLGLGDHLKLLYCDIMEQPREKNEKLLQGLEFVHEAQYTVRLFVDPHYGSNSLIPEQLVYLGPLPDVLFHQYLHDVPKASEETKLEVKRVLQSVCYQQVHVRLYGKEKWFWYDETEYREPRNKDAAQMAADKFALLDDVFRSWKVSSFCESLQ